MASRRRGGGACRGLAGDVGRGARGIWADELAEDDASSEDDEAVADVVRCGPAAMPRTRRGPVLRIRDSDTILPTLRVLPRDKRKRPGAGDQGVCSCPSSNRPRSGRGGRGHDPQKSEYRQKTSGLRGGGGARAAIYVLKSNTIVQMEASLTSIFSLEVRSARGRAARGRRGDRMVIRRVEPVELSPQNAYIRRLQHQMAERANLISRSRGREPYRRVRLYP